MIGQIIGNYKIEDKLGEGGMGAVYRGVDTMLDREVAIKALKPELASQTSVVERFRTEAVTLAKLNHPNVATLYTMFRQGEELYMVLEFVRGETLDHILQRRGVLPAEEAIPVFCQVLDGIDHAHELGIVHRDIKPANMMLTEKGTLKVLDFGIARLLGSARMTRAGNIIGTLEYMAPEQVRGLETDGRSDIYALGMMLYEVLTGKLPFDTENEFELMKAQTEMVPPSPRSVNPAIPEDVEAAIMKAIEKDPDKRFQTAGDFREVLMDAGFAASGTMHGITGTHKKAPTRPSGSTPSLNDLVTEEVNSATLKATRLGAPAPVSMEGGGMKQTRLGAAATPAAGLKATRLGNVSENLAGQSAAVPAQASFFSKLKPVHYAGAGIVLLLVLGSVIAIPLLLLTGGSKAGNTETNKISNTKTETPTQKSDVRTSQEQPVPTQQPAQISPASNSSLPGGSGGTLSPIDTAPKTDKPATTAPKPAAPKAPVAKPKKPSAEKLLT